MAASRTHALIVFGGGYECRALAADFCRISKRFMEDELQPLWTWTMNNTARLRKGPWPLKAVITDVFRSLLNPTVFDTGLYLSPASPGRFIVKPRLPRWITHASTIEEAL